MDVNAPYCIQSPFLHPVFALETVLYIVDTLSAPTICFCLRKLLRFNLDRLLYNKIAPKFKQAPPKKKKKTQVKCKLSQNNRISKHVPPCSFFPAFYSRSFCFTHFLVWILTWQFKMIDINVFCFFFTKHVLDIDLDTSSEQSSPSSYDPQSGYTVHHGPLQVPGNHTENPCNRVNTFFKM